MMKKIGMIAGLGPESTLDYYQRIMTGFRNSQNTQDYPEIVIYSVNLNKLTVFLEQKDLSGLCEWLLRKIEALKQANAEYAFIACNTAHIVFDQLKAKSCLPLISIVEKTCEHAKTLNLKKPALLGTSSTMKAEFYPRIGEKYGLDIRVPHEREMDLIHHKLMTEIELGVFKDSTKDELLKIVKRMKKEQEIDSVILGCTELPLILTQGEFGLPFLNTTEIHVRAVLDYLFK